MRFAGEIRGGKTRVSRGAMGGGQGRFIKIERGATGVYAGSQKRCTTNVRCCLKTTETGNARADTRLTNKRRNVLVCENGDVSGVDIRAPVAQGRRNAKFCGGLGWGDFGLWGMMKCGGFFSWEDGFLLLRIWFLEMFV